MIQAWQKYHLYRYDTSIALKWRYPIHTDTSIDTQSILRTWCLFMGEVTLTTPVRCTLRRCTPVKCIGGERSRKHWKHWRMRRKGAEGQTKYRSDGLCTLPRQRVLLKRAVQQKCTLRRCTPVRYTLRRCTPVKCTLRRCTPVRYALRRCTPVRETPMRWSPGDARL
jgi:hypothetical protein